MHIYKKNNKKLYFLPKFPKNKTNSYINFCSKRSIRAYFLFFFYVHFYLENYNALKPLHQNDAISIDFHNSGTKIMTKDF